MSEFRGGSPNDDEILRRNNFDLIRLFAALQVAMAHIVFQPRIVERPALAMKRHPFFSVA